MHACLNVDEIIRLIARELVASESKATAAALACRRKTFEDPVLDTLWETQGRPRVNCSRYSSLCREMSGMIVMANAL